MKKNLDSGKVWTQAVWMALASALLYAAYRVLHVAGEGVQHVWWGCGVGCVSAWVGYRAGLMLGCMPTRVVWCWVVLVCGVLCAVAWPSLQQQGVASAWFRALLVAPAWVFLSGYWGGSLGVLFQKGTPSERGWDYERWVAVRGMLSKHSPVLSTVTSISVLGVALGVWLVLVSLGVLSGFEHDLESKLIGAHAHVVLQKKGGRFFGLPEGLLEKVGAHKGVRAVAPVLEAEVALASGSNYVGGWVFGTDPSKAASVLSVLRVLKEGRLEGLKAPLEEVLKQDDTGFAAPAALPGIVLGVEMAQALGVTLGSQVRVLSPVLDVLTPVGPAPKSRGFKVVGIFSSKMYEYDARYAFVDMGVMQSFLEVENTVVSGVQVVLDKPEQANAMGGVLAGYFSEEGYEALDWKARNQTLFSALQLERVVAFVVLGFIILVASFSIVNTLTMSIFEKRKDIAILKTMGAHDTGIMKVFLFQGLCIGGLGIVIGTLLAAATVYALVSFGFSIPGDVYYIDALPVQLGIQDVVLVVLCAVVIVWNFAVYPAVRGASLLPVEGLRDG